MVRFAEFESLGVRVAAMSDKSDGGGGEAKLQARLCMQLGVRTDLLFQVRQVHGDRVLKIASMSPEFGFLPFLGEASGQVALIAAPEADGMITGIAGVPLSVRVADCVPLFLFDPEARVGGLLHAGREGTAQHIATKAVIKLASMLGAAPERLYAHIGPSAGPCCYEVSAELADWCARRGLTVYGRMVDLWRSNRDQLVAAGLPDEHITCSEICTICDGRFHSYRGNSKGAGRDARSGRNLAVLMI